MSNTSPNVEITGQILDGYILTFSQQEGDKETEHKTYGTLQCSTFVVLHYSLSI